MKLVDVTVNDIIEMASTRKIVCYGAGKALRNYFDRNIDSLLYKSVTCIADTNSDKLDMYFAYKDRVIPIVSVSDLCGMDNIFIIITTAKFDEIIYKLNSITKLDNVNCAIYRFTDIRQDEEIWKYPIEYKQSEKMLIPKTIHYCWFGGKELPDKYKKWIDSWKEFCPDYEIIKWDENNYDVSKNRYMYAAYKDEQWQFVSDYARLDIVNTFGGIYLDTDVELIKNIDHLLYQEGFMGFDATKYINLGLGFGATKGQKLIAELLDYYNDIPYLMVDGTKNKRTQPELQRQFFFDKGYKENGMLQIIDGVTIYTPKVLSPMNMFTGAVHINEDTVSVHHYEGSWSDEKGIAIRNYNWNTYKKYFG